MEEKTAENDYLKRENNRKHYDKRLILEIVKQVEDGMPRQLAREKYDLGKSSLSTWLKAYGSKTYHAHKRKTYTNLEKSTIVAAVEQGRMSIKQAQIAYCVRSEKSIRDWVNKSILEKGKFSVSIKADMSKRKKTTEEINPVEADLQKALQEAQLKIIALNTLIDVAEEQLKIDIRKKSGARRSSK